MWKNKVNIKDLNHLSKGTMLEALGIDIVEIGPDYLKATMPVDHRTIQPMGILHGGASAALAESMGSFASVLLIDNPDLTAVGTSINTNHLKSKASGIVTGTVKPIRVGRKVHVWQIEITDEKDNLISSSVLTTIVIERTK